MLLVVRNQQTANSKQQTAISGQKSEVRKIRQPDNLICCLLFAVCYSKLNPRSNFPFRSLLVEVLRGEKILNSKAQRFEQGNLLG